MLENLPLRETFVSALKNGRTCANELNVVVVRLLAVALIVARRRRTSPHSAAMPIPKEYSVWPSMEVEVGTNGSRRQLSCYVCPKGATTADDEPFPVGTVFVVETTLLTAGAAEIYGTVALVSGTPDSIFVMGKYASMDSADAVAGAQDGWAYATYDSEGEVQAADSASCGVCRLPLK